MLEKNNLGREDVKYSYTRIWGILLKFAEKLCILLIVGIVLVPGAYGEPISTGGGSKVEVSDGSSTEGAYTTNGIASQAVVSSSGVIDNIDINHWVKNAIGDLAWVGVQAKNAEGFSYRYSVHPDEGYANTNDAVWAEEWLDVNSASYIKAFSYASNTAGDNANAQMEITSGSLKGYHGAAYAGAAPWLGISRGAFVQQSADYATGNEILAETWSKNIVPDSASATSEVVKGTLEKYSSRAAGSKTTTNKVTCSANVDSMKASAPLGSIYNLMKSDCFLGDNSKVSISINKGNLYSYPISKDTPSSSVIVESGIFRNTYASQSFDAEAVGFGSYIEVKGHSFSPAQRPYDFYVRLYDHQSMSNYAKTA